MASFSACQWSEHDGPSHIFYNGVIYSVDPVQPNVSAMAVENGKILAIGGDEAILAMAGKKTILTDLNGQFAMPGLIEGHGHFEGMGLFIRALQCQDASTWNEIVAKVKEYLPSIPEGQWITGRGWHQEKWTSLPNPVVEGYPSHEALSAVTPNHPVILKHASGHALIANARAMELAEIHPSTPEVPGGRIIRDARGVPTGVFEENAMNLVTGIYEAWLEGRSKQEKADAVKQALQAAEAHCFAHGITTFQDAGSSRSLIEQMRQLYRENDLKIRLWVMIIEPMDRLFDALAGFPWLGIENDRLTVRAIKAYADGALGSHGAWLLESYADKHGFTGQNVTTLETLERIARKAIEMDLQLCVHAIGDRANREVLDCFGRVHADFEYKTDTRWRLEHAQHIHPDDIPRFHQQGVIASMQPIHCVSDAPFVIKRLGKERTLTGAYVWRSLLDAKAHFAIGTDVPIESLDPFANMYAALTRKRLDNGEPYFPEQTMSRKEVLYAYTLGNAWAAHEEKNKGSLSPGKWADFIILDRDLTKCTDDELRKSKVLKTYIAGMMVYEQKN